MRQILHVHRDGKYAAIDNPDAVVVDYGAQMIRVGLNTWPVGRPTLWRFLAFLLRSADLLQHYAAISEAIARQKLNLPWISHIANGADPYLRGLGMTLETVDGEGMRLHSDPRSTLECCKTIALGEPLPPRVRSIRCGGGERLTTHVCSPRRSTRASSRSAATR